MDERLGLWARRAVGFLIGFGLAVAAEFLLFGLFSWVTGHMVGPRGLGWVAFPFLAGTAAARFLAERQPAELVKFLGESRERRFAVAAMGSWVVMVAAYTFVADPFGDYMYAEQWGTLFKWLIVPPVVAYVAWFLFRWANRRETA